jgi:hypothetical protein
MEMGLGNMDGKVKGVKMLKCTHCGTVKPQKSDTFTFSFNKEFYKKPI